MQKLTYIKTHNGSSSSSSSPPLSPSSSTEFHLSIFSLNVSFTSSLLLPVELPASSSTSSTISAEAVFTTLALLLGTVSSRGAGIFPVQILQLRSKRWARCWPVVSPSMLSRGLIDEGAFFSINFMSIRCLVSDFSWI